MFFPELKSTKDFTFVDKGYNRINKDLTFFKTLTLLVGWIGEEGRVTYSVGGPSVASVAGLYEYNPDYIIVRNVVSANKSGIAHLVKVNLALMIAGQMKPVKVWAEVGQFLTKEIRARIDTLGLIDTGLLRDSVSWSVQQGETTLKEGK